MKNLNGSEWYKGDASAFNEPVISLDESRSQRLNQNRLSLAADLIGERSHARLPVNELVQADLILMVRSAFPFREKVGNWAPRSPLWRLQGGSLELFVKATSAQGFGAIQTLFNVKTLPEFAFPLNNFFSGKEYLARYEFRSRVSWSQLFNLHELIDAAKRQR